MAAMADSTPHISSLSIHSRNNPIDLTHDDEEPNTIQYHSPRSKRAYSDSLDSRTTDQCPPSRYQTNSPSTTFGSNNATFPSSTPDQHPPPQSPTPQPNNSSPFTEPYLPSYMNHMNYMNRHPSPRQQFLQPPSLPQHHFQLGQHMHPTPPPFAQTPFAQTLGPPLPHLSSSGSGHQVIDLTDSPSPPPAAAFNVPPGLNPVNPDDPPKTPVCIGQLVVNALILYPIPYLLPRDPSQEVEWAAVRLQYEHNPHRMGSSETIHIRTPSDRTPNGDIITGDNFAVVEQKVATSLGGMLGKGLIRLEAKIRRGKPNLPVTPLQMLVYTPKGNIMVVGNYLQQCNLLLDHPNPPYDDCRLTTYSYFNPHNPPPGGHNRPLMLNNRLYAPAGGSSSRWSESAMGRSQDVQRTQVDELFKHLKDGVELSETEPSPDVATRLYPHQKKALTFLLDREHEKPALDGDFTSLWRRQTDSVTQRQKWVNIVTEEATAEEPKEARGAILADDMGLGKTITCVALIAATLQSGNKFAAEPLEPPQQPPKKQQHPDPSHFAGAVWDMPSPTPSGKSKAKTDKYQEKLEAEYVRVCRIKARSRATLIICPLSTVANWEDQFREHWRGEVKVVGGNGGCINPSGPSLSATASTNGTNTPDVDVKVEKPIRVREFKPLRVYIYHGNARRPDPAFLADFDAVITTYATLASEFSKQNRTAQIASEDGEDAVAGGSSDGGRDEGGEGKGSEIDDQSQVPSPDPKAKKTGTKRKKPMTTVSNTEVASPLQSIHWFRVVLDEAHSIKETQTVGCRASCDLIADRRLCLTGTPVQNKLDDMFALIKFLRLTPFDDKNVWTKHISAPAKFGQREGVLKLRTIMTCITLRRTKTTKTPDGKYILALPPRDDKIIRLDLNESELEIYNQYFQESKAEFTDLTRKNQVMKNYVGILQRLLRLRQICDHKELIGVNAGGLNGAGSDSASSYEDIVTAISKEGINPARANAIFALLKEAATTQCIQCGGELCTLPEGTSTNDTMDTDGPPPQKRGRKTKGQTSRAPTRANSPSGGPRPILTRCQHLFCLECYRMATCPGWPDVPMTSSSQCSACQTELFPADVVEIKPEVIVDSAGGSLDGKKAKKETKEERTKRHERRLLEIETKLMQEQGLFVAQLQQQIEDHPNPKSEPGSPQFQTLAPQPETQDEQMKLETDIASLSLLPPNIRAQATTLLQEEIYQRSTKIKALIQRLMPFSIANPHSANYNPAGLDVEIVDSDGNGSSDNVIKTIVFSQWTSMLDKIEDALLIHKIRYDRLDGTMKREERSKALDSLKYDPGCEVLLVSLKAGGVGLNLTAAQRVILMDPCWNPAVEHQAVDRIHRLGQTKPVSSIKFIIAGSIEEKMLKIQERKDKLAQITLGARTKAEIMEQRMEQLKELFR